MRPSPTERRLPADGVPAPAPGPKLGAETEGLVARLLVQLGEDPERPGLKATPQRVAESLSFLTAGYRVDLDQILGQAVFEEAYDELVLVRDINFYSLCEHHLLPFFGVAHVGYLPHGRIIGLSKIPRLVDAFARRLQIQERMTSEIAQALQRHLEPRGVAVVVEADHLCTMMRGVEKPGNRTITSFMTGIFRRDPRTRGEFMGLIRGG
ncbi:MAG TPA: GTP cyclohydrolase I FolE [Candidatus Acidoferrales bacterium]|nr:GTP cyclohydrolase I FolE [Candidatus Acidoferrales bacterium]